MKSFRLFLENTDSLSDWNQLPLEPFSGQLYHGSTLKGVLCMIKNGLQTYPHNELCEDFFSTSINSRMIQLGGGSGFEFQVNLNKVLKLNEFYYDLLAHETGMEGWWDYLDDDDPDKEEWEKKAKQFGYEKTRSWGNSYGINNQCAFWQKHLYNNPQMKDVEGIVIPGFDSSHTNAEAEIAVTSYGLKKLENSITAIILEREWYEYEEGMQAAQTMIEEQDIDDDDCWDDY